MNHIIPFMYGENQIRVIEDEEGTPWFVAKDVARILGYSNHRDAIIRHCKMAQIIEGSGNPTPGGGNESLRLDPQTKIIPEPDVYRLIIKSTLPEAERFERWVFEELLPTIRQTGTYEIDANTSLVKPARELKAAMRIARVLGLGENQARLSANRFVKTITGVDCMAALQITHLVQEEQELHYTPTDLGKLIGGISGRKTNQLMEGLGYQKSFRDGKNRMKGKPTDKGAPHSILKDTGRKHGDGTPVVQLFWKETMLIALQAEVANA